MEETVMEIFYLLLFQVILILSNAVFACAEIAVLSVNELKMDRLAATGNKRAKRLSGLLKDPARFLATIQVAITLSGFLGSAFAADHFADPLVEWIIGLGFPASHRVLEPFIVILITLVLAYFSLVFGELVPKRLAMKKSEEIALGISRLVVWISAFFKPVVGLLSISTNAVLRSFGVDPNEDDDAVDEEDIRTLVDAASEKGTVDAHEKEFIQNVFEFNDILVGDIVTHRTGVITLMIEDDMAEWDKILHQSRHTRYPVCEGAADKVIGILDARDYFRLPDHSRESVMRHAVSPAYFVPESLKADVLFREMKKKKQFFSVVIDEYGGMAGIVTLVDLLEELLGDLHDEPVSAEEKQKKITQLDEKTWLLNGNVSLEELDNVTGINLNSEKHDTLTGAVFESLGFIPEDGETALEAELDTAIIKVTKIKSHCIESAQLTRKPQTEPEKEESGS